MEIRSLDPHDDGAAREWYSALYEGAADARVAPLVTSEVSLLTSLRSNDSNPNTDRRALGAWFGERCLGTALIDLPRVENVHLADIDIAVRPGERRRGIGGALFDAARAVAREQRRTAVSDEVNVPYGQALGDCPGGRFALARGFASKHHEVRLVLELPLPEAALAELAGQPTGYDVVAWTGPVPDRWIDAYARMRTLMERDVPSGELDRTPLVYDAERIRHSQTRALDQGFDLVTALVLDAGGEPAAYTTMFVMPDRAGVLQDDTFVLRAHRGHRLGTVAKVANLRQLARSHPRAQRVHTWTAEVNDAMRRINERFGFQAVESMHKVELTLDPASS